MGGLLVGGQWIERTKKSISGSSNYTRGKLSKMEEEKELKKKEEEKGPLVWAPVTPTANFAKVKKRKKELKNKIHRWQLQLHQPQTFQK